MYLDCRKNHPFGGKCGFRLNFVSIYDSGQPLCYKTVFMLISSEHEISTSHRTKMLKSKDLLPVFKLSDFVIHRLINVKMPTLVGILTFMS